MARVPNKEFLPAISKDPRSKHSSKVDKMQATAQTHQRRKDLDIPNTVNSESQWKTYITYIWDNNIFYYLCRKKAALSISAVADGAGKIILVQNYVGQVGIGTIL